MFYEFHIFPLFATLSIIISINMFIRTYNFCRYVATISPCHFSVTFINMFLNLNAQSLAAITDINAIYGKAFLAFILVAYPYNAMLVMRMAITQANMVVKLFLASIWSQQVFFMFVIHLFAVILARRFHRPANRLIKVEIVSRKLGRDVRTRLKLDRYIEQFHAKRQYGLTYGKCGDVTFQSFGKVQIYILVNGSEVTVHILIS